MIYLYYNGYYDNASYKTISLSTLKNVKIYAWSKYVL